MKTKATQFGLAVFSVGVLLYISITGFNRNRDQNPQQLTIFAASSLSDAMDDLADAFEAANPGVTIRRHYASSSQLAAQLSEGVQADIYASANEIQMGHVVNAGLAAGEPLVFATNQLTIAVPIDNPAEITASVDLATPGVSLILAAPGVPIRVYSDRVIEMLGDSDFQAAVYQNLVSEEVNVRQVVAKIALGEADAGLVYTSDITPDLTDRVKQVVIPDEFNLTAKYPIARLVESENSLLAQAFIDFILRPNGQTILSEWGFGFSSQIEN
jgi:molybdate transport system substrate-binding protein